MKRHEFRPEIILGGGRERPSWATLVDVRCGGRCGRRLVGAVLGFRDIIDLVRIRPTGRRLPFEQHGRYLPQSVEIPTDEWVRAAVLYCPRCGRMEEVTSEQVVAWAGEARAAGRRVTRVVSPAARQSQ